LPVQAQHLFGGQWDLLHRPAVKVETKDCLGLHLLQIRPQNQRRLIQRVKEYPDGKCICGFTRFACW